MGSVLVNMEIKWVSSGRNSSSSNPRSPIPVYISTNPSHINPQQLKHLYTTCNHSSHRFPRLDVDPNRDRAVVEPIDINKLRLALSHSAVVVSVFSSPHFYASDVSDDDINTKQQVGTKEEDEATRTTMGWGHLLQKVNIPIPIPLPPPGELVGFGRAVSDLGLTASIYDVMVIPSLRRMGIGKMIVRRILRMLTSRDVYDIAALCSPDESLFFKACGFGDDILGSTTMMYTRTVSSCGEGDHLVKCAGRKILLIPPLTVPSKTFKTSR